MLDLKSRDRCFIIGEAGTCHAGINVADRYHRALSYIEDAAEAGADAIKFQWFRNPTPETMFCWIEGDEARAPRWRQSALAVEEWKKLKKEADRIGIMLLASTFEHETVGWLGELGIEATKVASRAAEHFPYEKASGPFLISTGMHIPQPSTPADVYLQCEANYPSTAVWEGELPGFSDHSGTPERAMNAILRGCKLVEVHFYIDPDDAGPDLPASLDLNGLKSVCDARDDL